MIRYRLVICAAVLAILSPAAHAQRMSKVNGTRLLAMCSSKVLEGCDGYLAGVADALSEEHAACIPVAVTTAQLRAVVLKALHDHPEKMYLEAGKIVVPVLSTAYACVK